VVAESGLAVAPWRRQRVDLLVGAHGRSPRQSSFASRSSRVG
jgi:hypothetical protein